MIIQLLLTILVTAFNVLFSWLPTVQTLPIILGVDIDTQLVQGVGMFYTYTAAVWPVRDAFLGALVLFTYYGIKMVLRFFLGHRSPGLH